MKKNVIFRFDDIHPLMDIEAFEFIQTLSNDCPLSIMLCVIPENKDESLNKSNFPIPDFWHKLIVIESRGVTIGLHGLEHKLKFSKKSLLSVSKQSEYTGLKYEFQKEMILKGLSILRKKGLNPKFFAAPAHGFDKTTLKVLNDINFKNISDGFTRNVCKKNGLTWIPLKSWNPSTKFFGSLNTVCLHLNKGNIKIIRDGINNRIIKKEIIDFATLIKSCKSYTYLDYISENLYSILIKLLFIKKEIYSFMRIWKRNILSNY
tara:strand:- start:7118 stop:7903 length:786 start_codon:yes stop_codon:yes gene_type:complete